MPHNDTAGSRSNYWRQQIEAWQSSGQTQRAFCRDHDLNYWRFGYWRKKFRKRQRITLKKTSREATGYSRATALRASRQYRQHRCAAARDSSTQRVPVR